METEATYTRKGYTILFTILIILLFIGVGYTTYSFLTYKNKFEQSRSSHASTTQELVTTQKDLFQSQQEAAELATRLQDTEEDVRNLEEELSKSEENVDLLTKLQTIDPELLKKYSKVYFLNEHYRPDKLVAIDKKWWYPKSDDEFIDANVWPHLEELLEEAEDDDIDLRITSGFRTFDLQREIKSRYDIVYGQGTANKFSAPQGYSEHQLGTTVDFTTATLKGNSYLLHTTEAFEWLKENAHKYGFILSYPEENEYYQFEPWHWRFVGRELAEELHDRDMYFYEMDQKEIDSYRLNIFED